MTVENRILLELLEKMILTREMELRHKRLLADFYASKGPFIVFQHPSRGEEAVGIGVTAALRREDVMLGTHRGFPEYLGKGMSALDLLAEYLGKKALLDGRAGIQVSHRGLNIPPMTSCLGGSFAIAVGMAYAIKFRKEDRVVALFYGDGAYNEYDSHAAMLISSSLKLPLLFVARYNGWAQYTRSEEFNPTGSVAARGVAYNIQTDIADGNRIDVVYETAQKAIERVRSSGEPFIMEYKTFRLGPHWSGDTFFTSYMDKKENAEWLQRDPIILGRDLLVERGILSYETFDELSARISGEVDVLLEQALSLPYPDEQDMYCRLTAKGGELDA